MTCVSMISGFKAIIDKGAEMGCENFTIGMPHRGRLNVLANVMHKPMPEILEEFISGTAAQDGKTDLVLGSGELTKPLCCYEVNLCAATN